MEGLILTAAGMGLAAWSCVHEYRALGRLCPGLDDTFIHLRFAWNLAHGAGFAFNPGQPLPATTSPLWVVVLLPFACSTKDFLVHASLFLSTAAYLATILFAWLLAKKILRFPSLAVVVGGLVAMNGRLLWAGTMGMETDLFAALSLAGVLSLFHDEKKMSVRTGALFGLAAMARPEGYLLFLVALSHHLLAAGAGSRPPRLPLQALPLRAILAFSLIVLPYITFSLAVIHQPWPTTFSAKIPDLVHFRKKYLYWAARYFFMDNPLAAVLFPLSLLVAAIKTARQKFEYLRRPEALIFGWPVAYLIASVILTPLHFHFCRYQIPLLPFFLLVSVHAGEEFVRYLGGAGEKRSGERTAEVEPRRWVLVLVSAVLLMPSGINLRRWPVVITTCAENIFSMHVRAGEWLARATPAQARIATMDIGAIAFYSEREVIDLVGLVTPRAIPLVAGRGLTPRRSEGVIRLLRRERPEYLAIFPELYPGVAEDSRIFRPLFEINLARNQIVSSSRMVIYQCLWFQEEKPSGK